MPHIKLFFIVHAPKAKAIGNDLYKKLKYAVEHFPGLNEFIRLPINLTDTHITFQNADNPVPEIGKQLANMPFEPGLTYGAVYISPIKKDDPDPLKRQVYYRVKELLLKYKITSQVIWEQSPGNSSFAWYLPNIAIALLAKLGGIPWKLRIPAGNDLIVGIGAHRSRELEQTYLGSAFSFDQHGIFREFSAFQDGNLRSMAASIQKAVYRYWNSFSGKTPERIVIHFYKKMNKRETEIIQKALREIKLQVPIIIATIFKHTQSDYILSDQSVAHHLPFSGTWLSTRHPFHHEFMLCANTRYPDQHNNPKNYPTPLKVILESVHTEHYFDDKETVELLLAQIYQFGRLNWQTVKIKDRPITIYYPELVASKVPYFEEDLLPEFGTRNLWFL